MVIRFDLHQEKACRIERNAVIMAGAGSGKTSVLAERFAWLLETRRAEIEQVLSLTFTRKATAEMVEKIYHRLKVSSVPHIRVQLEKFDQAQIATLDSFCAQIVRNACFRFGLPPDFENDDEGVRQLSRNVAVELLLAHMDRPGPARLLERHGFERVVEEVFVDLAEKHLHLNAEIDFRGMFDRQMDLLRAEVDRHLSAWERDREALLDMEPRTATVGRNQDALRSAGPLAELHRQRRYAELASAVAGLKLAKPGGASAPDLQQMKEWVDSLRETCCSLGLLAATLEQEEALGDLFLLLEQYQRRLDGEKLRRRLLTFQDVAHLAVRALREDPELRRFYKERFRFIMIDEFQDNNLLQKELLYLLAERKDACAEAIPRACDLEPDKLFFVGDEKQSIYRFRGADVSVFKSLHEELRREGGEALALPTNYRSEPGLVRFFNRVFERVMAGAAESYEAAFLALEPKPEDARPGLRPEITFLYRPPSAGAEPGGRSPEECEAFRLAETILETVRGGLLPIAGPDGTARPAGFDDFALLLRSTGNQIIYERIFRRLDIPYTTQNARSLFLEAPLYDLYQLLQVTLYPEDTGAWAALLRSPLVNVSDHTLLELLASSGGRMAPGPAGPSGLRRRPDGPWEGPWDPFDPDLVRGFEEEERGRLELGRELLALARKKADRVPLTELVDELWNRAGYTYFILNNPGNHNLLEYYEYLIRMAERADRNGWGLAGFLEFIRSNLGGYEKQEELELLRGQTTGVQILTIHRAKGLEYPVVLLADTGNRGRNTSRASSPYYALPEYGFTFNLGDRNYFALMGREHEEKEEIAELKRLLYVGLTRARSHLVLSGVHNPRNQSSPRTHLNMLLAALGLEEPAEIEEETEGYRFRLRFIREVDDQEYRRPLRDRPKRDLEHYIELYRQAEEIRHRFPRREHRVTDLAAQYCRELHRAGAGPEGQADLRLPALAVDPVLQERDLEAVFGILTHHLIQQALLGREEDVPASVMHELPEAHRRELLEEARRLTRRFLDSEPGRLARSAEVLLPEYSFVHRRGDHWITGRADLYFETGAEAWLLDFKTDRSIRSQEYAAQLELYRLALQELTDREIVCRIFLLRAGRLFDPAAEPAAGRLTEEWLDRLLSD